LINECKGTESGLREVIKGTDENHFYITAKNYHAANGVATVLHEGKKTKFMAKGPMGKGCNLVSYKDR
jgi:hypothetical protein